MALLKDSKRRWVDPPSGWKYGFPIIYNPDTDGSLRDIFLNKGIPKEDIDFYLEYTRSWSVD